MSLQVLPLARSAYSILLFFSLQLRGPLPSCSRGFLAQSCQSLLGATMRSYQHTFQRSELQSQREGALFIMKIWKSTSHSALIEPVSVQVFTISNHEPSFKIPSPLPPGCLPYLLCVLWRQFLMKHVSTGCCV